MSSGNESGGISGGAPPLSDKLAAAQAVLTAEERMALRAMPTASFSVTMPPGLDRVFGHKS